MIFKNKGKLNKYKNQKVVTTTIRVNSELAGKIDELQAVCMSEKGEKVSKNKLINGIITSFISDLENTVQTSNEDTATKQLLAVLE